MTDAGKGGEEEKQRHWIPDQVGDDGKGKADFSPAAQNDHAGTLCSGQTKEGIWDRTGLEEAAGSFLVRGGIFIWLADVALTHPTKLSECIQPGIVPVTPNQA